MTFNRASKYLRVRDVNIKREGERRAWYPYYCKNRIKRNRGRRLFYPSAPQNHTSFLMNENDKAEKRDFNDGNETLHSFKINTYGSMFEN